MKNLSIRKGTIEKYTFTIFLLLFPIHLRVQRNNSNESTWKIARRRQDKNSFSLSSTINIIYIPSVLLFIAFHLQ